MGSEDSIWEMVFMAGVLCNSCTFCEPTLDWVDEGTKKFSRECAAARADLCPGVRKWMKEQKNGVG